MKGDFSRNRVDPAKRYSQVMMQQGRVQIDSDWNEQNRLMLDYVRTLATDLLGPGAGPAGNCGFQVVDRSYNRLNDFPANVRSAIQKGDLLLLPGRYYVAGIAVELRERTLYRSQAGYPFDDDEPRLDESYDGPWLAYLDVWEEFVSADQDPDIREPALGGVDTCGRARIMWRVRVLPTDDPEEALASLETLGTGKMKAWTKPSEAAAGPCIIPPDAKYRGVENQLYRVEIHSGSGPAGPGTFKWSRDNGSVTFPIRRSDGGAVALEHLGRDDRVTLTEGDWVEYVDDSSAARGGVGALAQVAEVQRDDLAVRLEWVGQPPAVDGAGLRPMLRRWDHKGDAKAGGAIAIGTGEIELEDGIFVSFDGGSYRAGDYWLVPARVATGDVLWPGAPDEPEAQPPDGVRHAFAPLASRDGTNLRDLRRQFKPLATATRRVAAATTEVSAAPGRQPEV